MCACVCTCVRACEYIICTCVNVCLSMYKQSYLSNYMGMVVCMSNNIVQLLHIDYLHYFTLSVHICVCVLIYFSRMCIIYGN